MKLLVTGGAGFIGTNLIQLLLAETDHHVVCFDLLTYAGRRENCAHLEASGRYDFVRGDVADGAAVATALAEHRIEAIIHLAAESHVDRSIRDATPFIRTNVQGTQTLLDAARDADIGFFLQVSTDEVYGELGLDDPPFNEGSPIRPSSPYAASKAAADLLVLAAHRTHGQPVAITRCSNNYGPYQFPAKLIPVAIAHARAGEPVPVYGRGTNVRDWIHVSDHCRGLIAVLEHGQPGRIHHFGGGEERRNIDLVKTLLAEMGCPLDRFCFVADRPGHDLRYAIDCTRTVHELGWAPRVSFGEGLRETLAWYAEHESWPEERT